MAAYDQRVLAAWLASAMIPPDSLLKLIRCYQTVDEIYRVFSSSRDEMREFVPEACFSLLVRNSRSSLLDYFQETIRCLNIKTLIYGENNYPKSLLELPEAPCILFYQGNPDCLSIPRRLSMVGSRKASYQGIRAARSISKELSSHHICIISGLAYGIDAASHQGCLQGGTPTAAVLGCGLDQTYPKAHASLRQEILNKGGIVISEYAPGEKPFGRNFPYRNRIISGLSHALIVMEARKQSGSLTTVDWAIKQNKEVFAYPGDPSVPLLNEGNHQLIRDGARFFVTAEHILEDMGWLDNPHQQAQNTTSLPETVHLEPGEQKIACALAAGSLNMDELCFKTGLKTEQVMSALTMLQIKKVIEILPGKYYQLKTNG